MKLLDRIKWVGELLWKHNLTRIALSGVLLLIGGIMSPEGTIGQWIDYKPEFTLWNWVMTIGAASLLGHILVFATYAWIINPIKKLKTKKRK